MARGDVTMTERGEGLFGADSVSRLKSGACNACGENAGTEVARRGHMLSKPHRLGLISVASVFSLGCASPSTPGGLASTVSCSLAGDGSGTGSHPEFCVEESGLTKAQAEGEQTACQAEASDAGVWTFDETPCLRANALGGCQSTVASGNQTLTTTQWYYAGGTNVPPRVGDAGADAVAALLCNTNETFVAP